MQCMTIQISSMPSPLPLPLAPCKKVAACVADLCFDGRSAAGPDLGGAAVSARGACRAGPSVHCVRPVTVHGLGHFSLSRSPQCEWASLFETAVLEKCLEKGLLEYGEFNAGEGLFILPRGGHAVMTGPEGKIVVAGEWHHDGSVRTREENSELGSSGKYDTPGSSKRAKLA